MNLPVSILTRHQKKVIRKDLIIKGEPVVIVVTLRYDDECKNGHNTFTITANYYETYRQPNEPNLIHSSGKTVWLSSCGCLHNEIKKHFPELKHLIKWHLVSSDGPMHYLANTLYLAGDKDYNGKRKGEPLHYEKRLYFNNFPIQQKISGKLLDFIETKPDFNQCAIIEIKHKDHKTYGSKYTIIPDTNEWHKCEFDTYQEAAEMLLSLQSMPYNIISTPTSFSKGKDPELESARKSAVAPNATLEQLQSKEWLIERLQDLMLEFKKDIEEIGFVY
jgi:hypothetical protein